MRSVCGVLRATSHWPAAADTLSSEGGRPVGTNGLPEKSSAAYEPRCLSALHQIILVCVILSEIMLEVDGPMLRYGIQDMNGRELRVPTRPRDCPMRLSRFALSSFNGQPSRPKASLRGRAGALRSGIDPTGPDAPSLRSAPCLVPFPR